MEWISEAQHHGHILLYTRTQYRLLLLFPCLKTHCIVGHPFASHLCRGEKHTSSVVKAGL